MRAKNEGGFFGKLSAAQDAGKLQQRIEEFRAEAANILERLDEFAVVDAQVRDTGFTTPTRADLLSAASAAHIAAMKARIQIPSLPSPALASHLDEEDSETVHAFVAAARPAWDDLGESISATRNAKETLDAAFYIEVLDDEDEAIGEDDEDE